MELEERQLRWVRRELEKRLRLERELDGKKLKFSHFCKEFQFMPSLLNKILY